jgi:hypothetical protein
MSGLKRAYDASWQPLLPSSSGNARSSSRRPPLDRSMRSSPIRPSSFDNETSWILYYIFAAIAEVVLITLGILSHWH